MIYKDISLLEDKNYNVFYKNEAFTRQVFSFNSYEEATRYIDCSFNRSDFANAKISNHYFDNCELTHMEAGQTIFENCIFKQCKFMYSNFNGSIFKGCYFFDSKESHNSPSPFTRASFHQVEFNNSSDRHCLFKNLHFKGLGFRYSKFVKCEFVNMKNHSTSFENATFSNCNFDKLDLQHSACRNANFYNCKCKYLLITFEKIISILGCYNLLKNSSYFKIIIPKDENNENIITSFGKDMVKALSSGINSLIENGKIFESLNIAYTIMKYYYDNNIHTNYLISYDEYYRKQQIESSLPIIKKKDNFFDFYITADVLFGKILEKGRLISLQTIVSTIKLMLRHNIISYNLLNKFLMVIKYSLASKINHIDIITLSELKLYFEWLANITPSDYLQVTISNKTKKFVLSDKENLYIFEDFLRSLLALDKNNKIMLMSLSKGSIIARLKVSIKKIAPLICIIFILGIKFSYKTKAFEFHFSSKEAVNNFDSFISIYKNNKISEKFRINIKSFSETIFNNILKEEKEINKLKKYIKQNRIEGEIITTNYLENNINKLNELFSLHPHQELLGNKEIEL